MNRVIKFRAWDKEQQYMAYQGTPDLETISSFFFHFGEDILMQFTGLADKNRKDVFESDIVLYKGAKGTVTYDNRTAMFMLDFNLLRSSYSFDSIDEEFEVIGNIHTNPELLK